MSVRRDINPDSLPNKWKRAAEQVRSLDKAILEIAKTTGLKVSITASADGYFHFDLTDSEVNDLYIIKSEWTFGEKYSGYATEYKKERSEDD